MHEWGHFIFARLFGVKVETFSIGFGPTLFSFKAKNGTHWNIAALPLGGFVKMHGHMLPAPNETTVLDDDPQAFHNKRIWQKMLIVLAGPLFNIILPFVIFLIVVWFAGVPKVKPIIKEVQEKGPAFHYLHTQDTILAVNNHKIADFQEFADTISALPNTPVALKVLRNNKSLTVRVKTATREAFGHTYGFLGVTADQQYSYQQRYGFLNGIKVAATAYKNTFVNIVYGFKLLLTRHLSLNDLGGPIKIFQVSGQMAQHGLSIWLTLLAALSFNLALINLLPIPALDGGHFLFYLVEAIIRRPLPAALYKFLLTVGYVVILSLMVLVTSHDLLKLFLK